jgi:hypothetical protein
MIHTITFPTKCFRAVYRAMADKDIRYYLCGVYLEHNGQETRLTATDGHRLHSVRHFRAEKTPAVSFIIPADMVKAIIKIKKMEEVSLSYDDENKTIAFEWLSNTVTMKEVDNRFPDYRRILPKDKPSKEQSYFNPSYLMDANESFKDWIEKKITYSFFHNGTSSGFAEYENLLCLVMPIRENGQPSAISAGFFDELT